MYVWAMCFYTLLLFHSIDPTATLGATILSYALGYRQFNESILNDMKELFDNPVKLQHRISMDVYEFHLSKKKLQPIHTK